MSEFQGWEESEDLPPGWGEDVDEGQESAAPPNARPPASEAGSSSQPQGVVAGGEKTTASVPIHGLGLVTPRLGAEGFGPGHRGHRRPQPRGAAVDGCGSAAAARGSGARSAPGTRAPSAAQARTPSAEDGDRLPGSTSPRGGYCDGGSNNVKTTLQSLKEAKKNGASLEETLQALEALQQQTRSLKRDPLQPPPSGLSSCRASAAAAASKTASSIAAAKAARSDVVRWRCEAESQEAQRLRKETEAAYAAFLQTRAASC
ncbi:unnamed protein product, partial [Polarella glacialis]